MRRRRPWTFARFLSNRTVLSSPGPDQTPLSPTAKAAFSAALLHYQVDNMFAKYYNMYARRCLLATNIPLRRNLRQLPQHTFHTRLRALLSNNGEPPVPADGSLLIISEHVHRLNDDPSNRNDQENILKRYMYHPFRETNFPRGYTFTCLSALAGYRQPSFNHRRIMRLDSTDILYIRQQLISIRFC